MLELFLPLRGLIGRSDADIIAATMANSSGCSHHFSGDRRSPPCGKFHVVKTPQFVYNSVLLQQLQALPAIADRQFFLAVTTPCSAPWPRMEGAWLDRRQSSAPRRSASPPAACGDRVTCPGCFPNSHNPRSS